MATKRRKGESFEDYKARQKADTKADKKRRRTGWFHHRGDEGTLVNAEKAARLAAVVSKIQMIDHVFGCILAKPPGPSDGQA